MMERTSWGTLAAAFLLAGTVAWTLLALLGPGALGAMAAPWLTALALAGAAVWLLARGRAVKNMVEGRRSSMTQLGAARVVSFAKASSLGGAMLGGVFAAATLVLALQPSSALRESLLPGAVAAVGASLLLVGAGMLVENWCRVPPEDDD